MKKKNLRQLRSNESRGKVARKYADKGRYSKGANERRREAARRRGTARGDGSVKQGMTEQRTKLWGFVERG